MARDYDREYRNYQGTPEQIKKRAQRNAARREMVERGHAHKGDGKDVDHRRPISKGGTNADGNLRMQSKADNRSFKRDSKGRPI